MKTEIENGPSYNEIFGRNEKHSLPEVKRLMEALETVKTNKCLLNQVLFERKKEREL